MSRGDPLTEGLFDPDFLRRMRALFFKLRQRHRLRHRGVQPTPALGFTREFKDYRQYTRSDDFRSIDWRLFARTERLFVKLYEEIQEFHVHILIDRSASMVDPFPRKRVAAVRLAAALAYLGLLNQHRVSIHSFGTGLREEIPPAKGQGHIHRMIRTLSALEFGGETDLRVLTRFRPRRDRRGIVFILSDLLGRDGEDPVPALQASSAWPAETHVVHVLDPEELRPQWLGDVQLTDVETGEQASFAITEADLQRYGDALRDHLDRIAEGCASRRLSYVPWRSDESFERRFLELLTRDRVLNRR